MHIVIVTQYFPPEIGAAATRWGEYSRILTDMGHKVTVLCEMPNYPAGVYYKGYRNRWVHAEKTNPGLSIIRTYVWANSRESVFEKMGHYLTFMVSALHISFKIKNYDILIVSSPPLFTGIIGLILSKMKGKRFMLDIRDLWPESAISLGEIKSAGVIKLSKWIESKIYRSAAGFIFAVPGFKKYFKTHHQTQCLKPMVNLINGVDKKFIELSDRYDKNPHENFTILFSGNIGLAQGLNILPDVAKRLEKYPIKFQIVGDGVKAKELKQLIRNSELGNIEFFPMQSKAALVQKIKSSSVCLVPLKNDPLFKNAIPSKLFEYMACGRPVVVSIAGEVEKIVKNANCGLMAIPEDANSMAKSIQFYINNREKILEHGQNGVMYIKENARKEVLISHAVENNLHKNKSPMNQEKVN